MSRYIDADALIKEIDMTEDLSAYDAVVFEEMIKEVPTAEVIEVVRCKDCKYYSYIQMGSNPGVCAVNILAYTATEPMNYCGYAERKILPKP